MLVVILFRVYLRCSILCFSARLGWCHVFIIAVTSSAVLAVLLIVHLGFIVYAAVGGLVLNAWWCWWFGNGVELLIRSKALKLVKGNILFASARSGAFMTGVQLTEGEPLNSSEDVVCVWAGVGGRPMKEYVGCCGVK